MSHDTILRTILALRRLSKGLAALVMRTKPNGHLPKIQQKKQDCCPYCIVAGKFAPMTVLSDERLICENCGHIVFPNDSAFRCPCPKCLEINFSPRFRRLRGGNSHGGNSL
jgi:hypothetical protein